MLKSRAFLFALVIAMLAIAWPANKIIRSKLYAPMIYTFGNGPDRYRPEELTDVFVVLVDHWEPGNDVAAARLWLENYKTVASKHRDSNNRPIQYTWAYPFDLRNDQVLSFLARAAYEGFGETEAQWHHSHSDVKAFEQELADGLTDFGKFGALIHEGSIQPRFAFVHGKWSLDNAIDGQCGINQEIGILQKHGAYADVTFPAPGTSAQPSLRNTIFRAVDDDKPKSHDTGMPVAAGEETEGLMIMQGPFGLDFANPLIFIEYGALDNQEITGFSGWVNRMLGRQNLWQPHRVRNWLRLAPRIEGKPEWAFIKLHAHGMQDSDVIFELIDGMAGSLVEAAGELGLNLHFVSAREAYNVIRSAEAGETGKATHYFDYEIGKPLNRIQQFPEPMSAGRSPLDAPLMGMQQN